MLGRMKIKNVMPDTTCLYCGKTISNSHLPAERAWPRFCRGTSCKDKSIALSVQYGTIAPERWITCEVCGELFPIFAGYNNKGGEKQTRACQKWFTDTCQRSKGGAKRMADSLAVDERKAGDKSARAKRREYCKGCVKYSSHCLMNPVNFLAPWTCKVLPVNNKSDDRRLAALIVAA